MEACKIEGIMQRINGLPYQKILFNGPWGVGKTKHILDSVKNNKNIYYISLFGKNNINVFYEELYYVLLSNTKIIWKKTLKLLKNISFSHSGFNISLPYINDVLKTIQQELKGKSDITIIIDDLERKSDSLEIKEIFGFIDSITKNLGIKVILLASTENLSKKEKEAFDDYSEKSIDRIYEITSYSSNAPQNIMGEKIWNSIEPLYTTHQVKNLRTLEKTKYFIEEVIEQMPEDIFNEKISKEDIYKICAAVIIFVVDHNKRRKLLPGSEENPPNYIWHFILNRKLKNSMMTIITPLILEWYETGDFSEQDFNNLFNQIDTYKESKSPIFMSDNQLETEIADFSIFINNLDKDISLSGFMQRLDELANIAETTSLEFNYSVEQVVGWVLEYSNFDNIDDSYFDLLPQRESTFINKVIENLKIKSASHHSNRILSEMIINLEKRKFNDDEIKVVSEFKLLYDRFKNRKYDKEKKNLINKMKENEWFLPLPYGEITDEHWSYCHNILQCIEYISDNEDRNIKEDACKYFNEKIDISLDEIFKYRMKSLMKQYLE